jgi:hypothetical protein
LRRRFVRHDRFHQHWRPIVIDTFHPPSLWSELAAAVRRWRADRATLAALERLDPRSRDELETMRRLAACEFDSKSRSVSAPAIGHSGGCGGGPGARHGDMK